MNDLRAKSLTLAGFLQNFGLAYFAAVITFLGYDGGKAKLCCLGGHSRTIIAAGGRRNTLKAKLFCRMYSRGGAPVFKAAGWVCRLILYKYSGPKAGLGAFAREGCYIAQLNKRRIANPLPLLDIGFGRKFTGIEEADDRFLHLCPLRAHKFLIANSGSLDNMHNNRIP